MLDPGSYRSRPVHDVRSPCLEVCGSSSSLPAHEVPSPATKAERSRSPRTDSLCKNPSSSLVSCAYNPVRSIMAICVGSAPLTRSAASASRAAVSSSSDNEFLRIVTLTIAGVGAGAAPSGLAGSCSFEMAGRYGLRLRKNSNRAKSIYSEHEPSPRLCVT